jgi:hypothetical protein
MRAAIPPLPLTPALARMVAVAVAVAVAVPLAACAAPAPPPPAPPSNTAASAESPAPDPFLADKPDIPPACLATMRAVRAAAAARDWPTLRAHMTAPRFTFSLDDDKLTDLAIPAWQAHPDILAEVVRVLDGPCAPVSGWYECPPDTIDYRAIFEISADGACRWSVFVAGD